MVDVTIQPHPYGIRPSGNRESLHWGSAIENLPDELIILILSSFTATELLNVSHTCKKLYVYGTMEDFWKDLYVANDHQKSWRGTWRNTYLGIDCPPIIKAPKIFSDALYKPYMNAHLDLSNFKPRRKTSQILRLPSLSLDDFQKHLHTPFILLDPVSTWKAMHQWTTEKLLKRFQHIRFRAESVDWTLAHYVSYMRNNTDESPLYLFDSRFAEKTNVRGHSLADEYDVPECFDEDLFKILGQERPDHRWLIIGPQRSGSTFHKDPNGTCAWNAVITGSKLWIMFPPDCQPPGVYVNDDESEVTSPLSIAEWLITYHEEARHTKGFLEGICHAGEVLYVPSGWWHLVVNLEECIAVTQNFVPRAYVGRVIKFLRDRRDQVSGFDREIQAYELFVQRLKEHDPELWNHTQQVDRKRSAWDAIKADHNTPSFSFGFASE